MIFHPRTRLRCLATVLVATLALAVAAVVAPAFSLKVVAGLPTDGGVTLTPGAMRVTTSEPNGGKPIGPGVTAHRAVVLQNRTPHAIDVRLEVSSVVGCDQVVCVRHGVHEGAAAWASLDRTSVHLPSRGEATFQLTIAVPRTVTPGSKAFAISALQRPTAPAAGGSGVTAVFGNVALFVVELPGNAPVQGSLRSLDLDVVGPGRAPRPARGRFAIGAPGLAVALTYANTGERLLTPHGTIEVRDLFGRLVDREQLARFTVYPGGSQSVLQRLRGLPTVGWLRTKVQLDEGIAGRAPVSRTLGPVLVMPTWLAVLAGLVVAALVAWLVVALARYARARREPRATHEQAPGDDAGHELDDLPDLD